MAELFNFDTVMCGEGETPKSKDEIHEEVAKVLRKVL